jgi:uncharacterized protein
MAQEPSAGANQGALPEKLLAFLANKRSYPHRPRNVHLIQTHASYIFLARPYVYKVKKSVNLGFLDFSTLEKRRYFSEREVMLNRRLSSDIHLGVVPIFSRNGRLSFEEGGKVIEYAVKMRALDERHLLSRLLNRNEVDRRDIDRIVSKLKRFYESQETTNAVLKWGGVQKLKISTRENFRQMESFVGTTISASAFKAIRFYTDEFFRRNVRLFEQRIRERRIRDCHGDLHLGNIHLTPAQLSIYDCIEFNDRFRYIDVANDVAFLAMDFDYQGQRDLSQYFSARMAEALGDPGMLELLDFYKCYRAFVRGKVDTLQSAGDSTRRSPARARRYFQLALQYAVCGSEPMIVIVMGRIASGKSVLSKSLSRDLGWKVLSSDRTRKELAGVPLYKRGDTTARRKLYSQTMSRKTYQALAKNAGIEAAKKGGAILDATYSRRDDRQQLRKWLQRKGLSYRFVETQASDSTIKQRLTKRGARGLSDARREDFETLVQLYERPVELSAKELISLRTAKDPEIVTIETLRALAHHRLQSGDQS